MNLTNFHPFRSEETQEKYLALYDNLAKEWPIDSETVFVNTSYGKTLVRISGQDNSQPLVLLPGVGTNSLSWIPHIQSLSEKYRTYAIDYIYDSNCGRSIYSKPIKNIDEYMNWLDELFNALKLRDGINILGISLGSWLTARYALKFPSRVRKIALLAPGSTVLPMKPGYILRMLVCAIPHKYFFESFNYWCFKDAIQKDDSARKIVTRMIDETYLALRSFNSKLSIVPTKLTDVELKSIKAPVLFLIGENEKQCSAFEAVQRLDKVAPHIKAEIIEDAGHDLIIVHPEKVISKVLEFLK